MPENVSAKNETANIALVIILSVIWGLAFVAIKSAVQDLTPVNLTLLRWFIVSGTFLVLAPFIGKPKTSLMRSDIPRFVLVSFASVGGYHLSLNYAETIVSAGLAGLLISFGPIFVVLLYAVFLKERIGAKLMIALALAVAGGFVLSINADLSFQQMTGPLGVVLSAFLYGVYTVGSKPLVNKYGAMPVAVWVAVLGTIFLLPLLSWSFVTNVSALSTSGWISVLYLAILSTVLANIILYTLIGGRTVSRLSVQLYLIPIVSLVGGILLLGESLTVFTILGAGLMLTATALATRRK